MLQLLFQYNTYLNINNSINSQVLATLRSLLMICKFLFYISDIKTSVKLVEEQS